MEESEKITKTCERCGNNFSNRVTNYTRCNKCRKEIRQEESSGMKITKAANGYHGYVYHPTHFLAGEAGRERVDIYPMKKKSKKHHSEDYGFGVPSFIKGFEF